MKSIEQIFRLRRLWSICAILFLSASVNLLTGLPSTGWDAKTCLLRTVAIIGVIMTISAGVLFQLLFEDISSYFSSSGGVMSEAAKLAKEMGEERGIFWRCLIAVIFALIGGVSWIVYLI